MKKLNKVCLGASGEKSEAPHIFVPAPAPFIDSRGRKFLSVLEILFSCLIVLFVAYAQLFITTMGKFDTLYEIPSGAQASLGLGMVALIPLLFLLALWKKSIPYVKYGFLGLGILALISILPMLFIAAVFPDEPFKRSRPTDGLMMLQVLRGFSLIPLLGLGCLWRYGCLLLVSDHAPAATPRRARHRAPHPRAAPPLHRSLRHPDSADGGLAPIPGSARPPTEPQRKALPPTRRIMRGPVARSHGRAE